MAVVSTIISVIALAVAALSYEVAFEKFRLDLYNKRFDIYLRTVKFYQALVRLKESKEAGAFEALHIDFIIASRESQFLFSPNSGVHQFLEKLNSESFKIIGHADLTKQLAPQDLAEPASKYLAALSLWNSSIEQLEALMAPYLNYHYIYAHDVLFDHARWLWLEARKRIKRLVKR